MRMRTFALAKNAKHLQIRRSVRRSVIAAAPQSHRSRATHICECGLCIGEECEAFANSTQCHCGGTAIPKEKMRCYSNAPPVAELPADRKKFCKRRKSGIENNRGPRAKSLILTGANSMQRTAVTAIFFCMLTLPHKCGVWRCYSNAPPVAELPADRKKFCKRRKSGAESNRGPRAKSLILAGVNSMQRTAVTAIFFCMLTLPHKCGVWRRYSNAPPVAELPLGSFLATQCSAPRDGVISLRFGEAHASRSRPET